MGKMKILKTKDHITKRKSVKQYFVRCVEKDKRTGSHTSRIAPDWWEREIKGGESLRRCTRCGAVYFDKHWHTIPRFWEVYKKMLPRKKIVDGLCIECKWVKSGHADRRTDWAGKVDYEGEVILENLISRDKNEILNLIRNIGKRAIKRDPQDQIIRIKDEGRRVIITTTENQLAVSIGKQVDRAFKGGNLEIKWSHEDAPARVRWTRR